MGCCRRSRIPHATLPSALPRVLAAPLPLQGLDKRDTLEKWPDPAALREWRLSFAGR